MSDPVKASSNDPGTLARNPRLVRSLLLALAILAIFAPAAFAARGQAGGSDETEYASIDGVALAQSQAGACTPNAANVLNNGSFESGAAGWNFFTSGRGSMNVGGPAADCSSAAHINLDQVSNNMQVFQNGFALKANTKYRLSFSAFSSSGNDLRVYLQQHNKPYGSLGLNGNQFNLSKDWQQFSTEFTTSGFSGTTTNTRLRFWFVRYAANGDVYHLDNIVLEEVGGSAPPATPAPGNTPAPTEPSQPGPSECYDVASLLTNPGFEDGTGSWKFYTNGSGNFSAGSPSYQCAKAAKLTLTNVGTNTQFFQNGFPLQANTRYRLSFAAYSSSSKDMRVFLQKHGKPYTGFGLNGDVVNLTNSWKTFTIEFTTSGFSGSTSDTRLRFWFPGAAGNGDVDYIDAVELQQVGGGGGGGSTPPPSKTPPPPPSATPPPGGGGGGGKNELLVYDWNGPVTEAERGFPYNQPPRANGDWTKPVNYAEGTLYYRVEIRNQPKPQNMRIQFCFWQEKNGNRFALENCGPQKDVYGKSGTVETWSVPVSQMWKLGGKPIEWQRPRYRNGAAIKNSAGQPVSNYNGWNWNRENPKDWYPLNWRYTVVVVAKGSTFSGWDNYK